MKADLLREKFLIFFKARKHRIVESDSLVPQDDPTVLFTPAGMNQFKKQFMGYLTGFTRAATSQRCLRTDDLDKVGKTPAHHTFFEMLGNFSFGDYFKEEAISWAWEFLTEELKIKKERLWVSVYKDDDEAYKIWKDKIKVAPERIMQLGDKENFWPAEAKEKGPNGPCGPCSEIFFDKKIELWNLVFTQFNRKQGGVLEPLPKKNIDTGMGLERLAAVMQEAENNFETDLFRPIISEIGTSCKVQGTGQTGLVYAVADHIRAIVFAIYDRVLPSNEERGYVVRKLIRKSALHLRTLGLKKPFLYKLVPAVAQTMQAPYPELKSRRENIADIILAEEKSFISTLDSSEALFKEKFKNNPGPQEAGRISFQLYDTYGIPLELTQDWLNKNNIQFSEEAFDEALQEQKSRSKSKSAMQGDVFGAGDLYLGIKDTEFLGYEKTKVSAKVIKIIQDGKVAQKISKGQSAEIILDKTAFYAEAGGQVGDSGVITKGKNIFIVSDTKKTGKASLHIGEVKEGVFKKGDLVSVCVDQGRRLAIARNHTATHLLQAALRQVLGPHVKQQGSLVEAERLRFDFTHFKSISKDELSRIEEVVNGYILDNYPLKVKSMPLAEAKKSGALAFFGEKYEGKVRVVSAADVSQELCGGTHLTATGQIGIFKITQEGSIAAGVRRLEAITADAAQKKIKEEENIVYEIASALNVPEANVLSEIQKRLARLKELEKQLNIQRTDALKNSLDTLIQSGEDVNGIRLINRVIDNLDMDGLRKAIDLIKQKTKNSVIVLGSSDAGRALLVMGATDDLCQKGLDVSKLISEVAEVIGGSGGGRKDFAQAGGTQPQNFAQAFAKLKGLLRK